MEVWPWARLVMLVAASVLTFYVLLDNNIAMTSWEWETGDGIKILSYKHTPTCRKIKGVGFEKDYCLYETKADNTEHILGLDNDFFGSDDDEVVDYTPTSGVFECKDVVSHGNVFLGNPGNPVNPISGIDDVCCDRMSDAHKRMIAGASFVAAGFIASLLAFVKAVQPYSAYACVVFVAVATGLLGSALGLSDTNGAMTCNDSWSEFLRFNFTETGDDDFDFMMKIFGYGTSEEKREEGFWILLSAVVVLGTLLLAEIVLLGFNRFQATSNSNIGATLHTKLGELIF